MLLVAVAVASAFIAFLAAAPATAQDPEVPRFTSGASPGSAPGRCGSSPTI